MIDIQFRLNGRPVRPNQLAGALEKELLKGIETTIRRKLATLPRSADGTPLKVTMTGRSLDNLSVELSGDAETIERARKLLS